MAAGVAAISAWPDDGGTRISPVVGLARRFTKHIAGHIGAEPKDSPAPTSSL